MEMPLPVSLLCGQAVREVWLGKGGGHPGTKGMVEFLLLKPLGMEVRSKETGPPGHELVGW